MANTIKCTMCWKETPLQFPDIDGAESQVENGVQLIFQVGYGMFTDVDFGSEWSSPEAILCHDCVIKVLDLFPEPFRRRFQDGHAVGTKGCDGCSYSFQID